MTIRKYKYVNLLKHNPNLTLERIRRSEESGILQRYLKAGKLIKVDKPEIKKVSRTEITESKEPIYTKTHSTIVIDPKEKEFIDQLETDFIEDAPMDNSQQVAINERFLKKVDLEGFADPLADLLDE